MDQEKEENPREINLAADYETVLHNYFNNEIEHSGDKKEAAITALQDFTALMKLYLQIEETNVNITLLENQEQIKEQFHLDPKDIKPILEKAKQDLEELKKRQDTLIHKIAAEVINPSYDQFYQIFAKQYNELSKQLETANLTHRITTDSPRYWASHAIFQVGIEVLHPELLDHSTIVLVRHGRTKANQEGRLSKDDESVTTEGVAELKAQLEILRERLEEENIQFDYILCSDLARTKESAEIASKIFGVPIITKESLKERVYDESLTQEKLSHLSNNADERVIRTATGEIHYGDTESIDMENASKLVLRGIKEGQDILQEFPNKNLLIITSGSIGRCLLGGFNPLYAAPFSTMIQFPGIFNNAGIVQIQPHFIDGYYRVKNDTSLPELDHKELLFGTPLEQKIEAFIEKLHANHKTIKEENNKGIMFILKTDLFSCRLELPKKNFNLDEKAANFSITMYAENSTDFICKLEKGGGRTLTIEINPSKRNTFEELHNFPLPPPLSDLFSLQLQQFFHYWDIPYTIPNEIHLGSLIRARIPKSEIITGHPKLLPENIKQLMEKIIDQADSELFPENDFSP